MANQPFFEENSSQRRNSRFLFLLLFGLLFIIGFYTVTNPERLADHNLLHGADYVGYAFCHRITSRTFMVAGRQMPLCARCTGMYLGVALTIALVWLSGRWRRINFPPLPVIFLLVTFIGLMGIDGINSYSHFFPNLPHLYTPQNWLRLTTGMGTGIAMGTLLLPILAQTLWRKGDARPIWSNFRELAGVLFIAAILILLILSNQPTILYVLAIASAAGLLFLLTAINTVFGLILFHQESKGHHLRDSLLPILGGLTAALIQISIVAIIRFNATGTMTGLPGLE